MPPATRVPPSVDRTGTREKYSRFFAVPRRTEIDSNIIPTNTIENITLCIKSAKSETRPVTVYKSVKKQISTSELVSLLNIPTDTIVAGDVNVEHQSWYSHSTNTAGRTLEKCFENRLALAIIAPFSPTHYPNLTRQRSDILVIVIMKTRGIQSCAENLSTNISSDHKPIVLKIFSKLTQYAQLKTEPNWLPSEADMNNYSSLNGFSHQLA